MRRWLCQPAVTSISATTGKTRRDFLSKVLSTVHIRLRHRTVVIARIDAHSFHNPHGCVTLEMTTLHPGATTTVIILPSPTLAGMHASEPTGRTILITGGAGFIGSHLAAELVRDNDVRILDSLTTGSRSNVPDGATLIEGDLRDEEALTRAVEGVDWIFHEAALVSVQESIESPLKSHAINVDATLDLLTRAREEDAKIVLASSAAIYGHPEAIPVAESERKTPTSPYGLDKLTVDHSARQYQALYDLDAIPLRYFNVYGPRQPPNDYSGVISIFIDQALTNQPITIYGDGNQTRDFVYIDDVVQANLLAAQTTTTGRAYNVGTGESVTIRELAETIIDVTDSNSDIVHTDEREGDIRHSEADITAAQEYLGYEPTVSLREGLERTVEWFENEEVPEV